MKALRVLAILFVGLLSAHAVVVRPAPNFTFPAPAGKPASLRSLRGQAVVLLIGDSARQRAVRRQVSYLEEIYQQFASRNVVFVAALRDSDGAIKSNIPFVLANNGPAIAAAYGADDGFQLVIIGKDGNVDYQTGKVCTGQRVRDVIQNSFVVQAAARKP